MTVDKTRFPKMRAQHEVPVRMKQYTVVLLACDDEAPNIISLLLFNFLVKYFHRGRHVKNVSLLQAISVSVLSSDYSWVESLLFP